MFFSAPSDSYARVFTVDLRNLDTVKIFIIYSDDIDNCSNFKIQVIKLNRFFLNDIIMRYDIAFESNCFNKFRIGCVLLPGTHEVRPARLHSYKLVYRRKTETNGNPY